MGRIRVTTVVGTRPEIIRLSRVISLLDQVVDHRLIHTGQNHDASLNEVFFKELRIRDPDEYLDVRTDRLGNTLGDVLSKVEPILAGMRPDAVLILGDTNSSIAGLMAKRLRIPLYHMEAGNRCFDANVPEEVNRRLIDHISDFNLVYTEHARRNLLAEGLPPRRIYVTGSPMFEVLQHYRSDIDESRILETLGLSDRGYMLVSMHRQENVDDQERLVELLLGLEKLVSVWKLPIIVTTHPRTRRSLDALPNRPSDSIRFLPPFGLLDYGKLQLHARCVLSDSGTISEESLILGFPAVTMRESIERPEALDVGGIVTTGICADQLIEGVRVALALHDDSPAIPPVEYQISDCSRRVVNLIVATARLSNEWDGVRNPPAFW